MEESELIRLAQQGDREAFRGLVDVHTMATTRTARVLMQNPADAEEAVQEAWIDAWRSIPSFRNGHPFRPWILTLVANRCRMKARRRTHQTMPIADDFAQSLSETPSWASVGHDFDVELHEALGSLEAEQKQVLALRFYADLQLDEIADLTGAPLGTVKSRLHRGIANLRTRLMPAKASTIDRE